MDELPKKYEYDYMVFSISKSISEEKNNWDLPLSDVMRRFAFLKFDSYIEYRFRESQKNG